MSRNIHIEKEPTLDDMKKNIAEYGGLFYQYRPCKRDAYTIYDIENIRNGKAYAQTPLNMNDPFDSMIGFSPEKIYENCISLLVEAVTIEDENLKIIIMQILKFKVVGKSAELLLILNDFKKYLYLKQIDMHQSNLPINIFISNNLSVLYSKSPKQIKNIFPKENFAYVALVVSQMGDIYITEESLKMMLGLDDILDELYAKTIEVKDSVYIPTFQTLLSGITVSCFSASGWDNQLMWSHYANSYSGICVEYDFSKMNDFIGFTYPVEYTTQRPTVSLNELGIKKLIVGSDVSIEYCDSDIVAIFSYLLVKNTCWNYEKEWRIINVGEPNTPFFIDLPFIKSVTLGINTDSICKRLLWDVCKTKQIDCYEISTNTINFDLSRRLLTDNDFAWDIDTETEYVGILSQQIANTFEKAENITESFDGFLENATSNFSRIIPMLANTIDIIANSYYLKISLNRIAVSIDTDLSLLQMPKVILEMISQVNSFIVQIKETIDVFQDALPRLRTCGYWNNSASPVIQKHLFDIQTLIENFDKVNWNEKYIDPKNKGGISGYPLST